MSAPKGAAPVDVLAGMSDAALARKADRLLFANRDRMTYREKRKNADAYMRVKAEIERRATLATGGHR